VGFDRSTTRHVRITIASQSGPNRRTSLDEVTSAMLIWTKRWLIMTITGRRTVGGHDRAQGVRRSPFV
jgi:hypothetical protein